MFANRKVVVVDVDGTLANISHRKHFVEGAKKKNWKAFIAGIPFDTPHEDIIELVQLLAIRYNIVLCSGRNEFSRQETVEWMSKYGVFYQDLFMRADLDYRADNIVKYEILQEKILPKYGSPFLILDDRDQVVNEWRNNGLRCLQVASGAF